jgi:hypothetical protein
VSVEGPSPAWLALCQFAARSMNGIALTIQRVYRGFLGRKQARALRRQMNMLAMHAQRIWRARVARRRLVELRQQRIAHWAAARLQAVFRARRQRKVLRLWKSRQWMAAQAIQTVWRVFFAQRRQLDVQDDDLTEWMLHILDYGYSRDPSTPSVEMYAAHSAALRDRLERGRQGERPPSPLGEHKAVMTLDKEDVDRARKVADKLALGVIDMRKVRRPRVTTTKVWSLIGGGDGKKSKEHALAGRAALVMASSKGGLENSSVYMGPPPRISMPRILVPVPPDEASKLLPEDGLTEDDVDAAAGLDERYAGASDELSARRREAADEESSRTNRKSKSGNEPHRHRLEAPPGTSFDRGNRFGRPSIAEVLDDMRRISDALQWHAERRIRQERRRAAYAVRSSESKAQREALKSRMLALKSTGTVEQTRRLRCFVTGITEIAQELKEREGRLGEQAKASEERMRTIRAALRKFDRSARDSLRKAGGLLDRRELAVLLAALPSAAVVRAQTAAHRENVGMWEKEAPEQRLTSRALSSGNLLGVQADRSTVTSARRRPLSRDSGAGSPISNNFDDLFSASSRPGKVPALALGRARTPVALGSATVPMGGVVLPLPREEEPTVVVTPHERPQGVLSIRAPLGSGRPQTGESPSPTKSILVRRSSRPRSPGGTVSFRIPPKEDAIPIE